MKIATLISVCALDAPVTAVDWPVYEAPDKQFTIPFSKGKTCKHARLMLRKLIRMRR